MAQESATHRILSKGIDAATDLELLTTLTGSVAVSTDILSQFGSLTQIARASVPELVLIKGVGRKIALRIISAFELFRRKEREHEAPIRFSNSQVAADYMRPKYADASREIFSVLFINRSNELIAEEALFTGGVSAVVVDAKVIFKKAINYLASSIIVVHNHPSGNLRPSKADVLLTKNLQQAGKVLEIKVMDHVIVSSRGYYSFADDGMM